MKKILEDYFKKTERFRNIKFLEQTLDLKDLCKTTLAEDKCLAACKNCLNYGKLWTCPPFVDSVLSNFGKIDVLVCRIPTEQDLSVEKNLEYLYLPVKSKIHEVLIEHERAIDGLALSFAGTCDFCNGEPCSRLIGRPCRHPELARRSLEGIGFDVEMILNLYFDVSIEWADDGVPPEYLTFVAALVHN